MAWLSLLVLQEPWWDQAWQHRRAVRVRNTADRELPAGTLVVLRLDLEHLGIRGKSRQDLRDLRLVHQAKALPVSQWREGKDVAILFPLPAPIPPAGTLALYLYYGSPEASEPEPLPQRVVQVDFAVESDGEILEPIGGAAKPRVQDSCAILEAHGADGSWRLRGGLPADGFRLRLEGLCASDALPRNPVRVILRPAQAGATEDELGKARKLLSHLGSEATEVREAATRELIRMGPPIAPLVRETLASTKDPEVQWRCREILTAVETAARSSVICVTCLRLGPRGAPAVLWEIHVMVGEEPALSYYRELPRVLELVRDANGEVTATLPGQQPVKARTVPGAMELEIVVPRDWALRLDGLRLEPAGIERSAVSFEIDVDESRP